MDYKKTTNFRATHGSETTLEIRNDGQNSTPNLMIGRMRHEFCVFWNPLLGGFNPFEKCKLDHFPNFRGEHKKPLKPPHSPLILWMAMVRFKVDSKSSSRLSLFLVE